MDMQKETPARIGSAEEEKIMIKGISNKIY
jgi:hypothetical protein